MCEAVTCDPEQWEATDPRRSDGAVSPEAIVEALLASSPVGIGYVDREYRIVRINQPLADVHGSPIPSHLGLRVPEAVPGLWSELEPLYRRVLDLGETVSNVIVGPSAGDPGRLHHWLTIYYPVRVGAEITGVGISAVDITLRHEALQAREDLIHASIGAIAATVEARDPYTAGHQRRVAAIAAAIALELGVAESELEGITLAAEIHDVGKIGIPSEILSKPGKLRSTELELVKDHARLGYDIVAGIAFSWPVADMIVQHHERLDGSGYPMGLRGDEICLGAQIIAVADVVEAMFSHRPYRPALGMQAALEELLAGRATRYRADAVDACIRLAPALHENWAVASRALSAAVQLRD